MIEQVLVGEAVAGAAAKAMSYVQSLIENVNKQTVDLAEALYVVKTNRYYESQFTTFKDYTLSLQIKPRRAQYLTKIVETFSALGIERTVYEPLGIAKLREITSLDYQAEYTNPLTQEKTPMSAFIAELVQNGADMELEEIKKTVRTLKGFVGQNDLCWLNLSVTRSVLDNTVRPALELAKAHIGSVSKDDEGISKDASDGAALEVLAIEYLNSSTNGQQESADEV